MFELLQPIWKRIRNAIIRIWEFIESFLRWILSRNDTNSSSRLNANFNSGNVIVTSLEGSQNSSMTSNLNMTFDSNLTSRMSSEMNSRLESI